MWKILSTVIVGILVINGLGAIAANDLTTSNYNDSIDLNSLSFTVTHSECSEYKIINQNEGQTIEIDGYGYLMIPGKPMLPSKNVLIALPPGAAVRSVTVEGIDATMLPGTYDIIPSPPIMPLDNSDQDHIAKLQEEWQENYESTFSSNQMYPSERGHLEDRGTLRKYQYISVALYPFSYHPRSGRLIYYDSAQILISYSWPSPSSSRARLVEELKWDTLADEKASKLFINYQQIKEFYQPTGVRPTSWSQSHDYIIITTGDLSSAITSSDFLDWKTSLGYNARIVLTTDDEITNQPGGDLAEQIRNFLRSYYGPWGIKYVLLVGDYVTIPMRYCYPDPTNHLNGAGDPSSWPWSGDVPTDYYYADLSYSDDDSWDSDGDGYLGEFLEDTPDFLAEVYVGRIPTNDIARITYTLNKLVAYEQDTGTWKENALHAGAIAYFYNEDHSGRELNDGATLMDDIETDIMDGLTISHYSEQEGLAPSEYDWSALSEAAFIGDWRNGQYGVVNWCAHGWSNRVARKVWSWDDGDGVPESNEMTWPDFISINSDLDDDYPSLVFAVSCLVGYPEPNTWGNLGIDLLSKPSFGASVGIVSGTRVVWVSKGGGDLHCYEFNRYMINGPSGPEKVGEALYDSEFYIYQTYNWDHYSEYWNIFTYNLYGDPSLVREGISDNRPEVDIIQPVNGVYLANMKILPFFTPVIFGAIDIEINATAFETTIEHVDIFIDGELKATITSQPYTWTWTERTFGKKTIKAIAYTTQGLHDNKELIVWKFF